MKTIIFLEAQKQGTSFEIIKDAKELGYKVVLITDNHSFLIKKKSFMHIDEIYYMENFEFYNIKNFIDNNFDKKDLCAIISVIEKYMFLSVKLHNLYCLNKMDTFFYQNVSNKLNVRKMLNNTEYNINYYTDINNIKTYPYILKNVTSSGSGEVYFIENENSLKNIDLNSFKYLIEDYIDEEQYLIEIIVQNNKLYKYFILKQDIRFIEKFIIEGYSFENEKIDGIEKLINELIKKFHLKNISFHIEVRKVNNIFKIIEINSRTSGGCITKIIEYGTGFKITNWILHNYLNTNYQYTSKNLNIYARYKISSKKGIVYKITGRNKILKNDKVLEFNIRKIKNREILPTTSMGKRYAYVITTDDSINDAKKNAIKCIETLKFHIH